MMRFIRCKSSREKGVVLLMALVALLLISAVGAAILFMATSESNLVGAQKSAARSFYASLSGLEEVRVRTIRGMPAPDSPGTPSFGLNPDPSLGGTVALPQGPGPGFGVNQVLYLLNPAPGEAVNPTDPANAYFDCWLLNQCNPPHGNAEIGPDIQPPVFLPPVNSAVNVGAPWRQPYKWVRVILKTEYSARQDLNFANDGGSSPPFDQVNPVFYYAGRQYRMADLAVMAPSPLPPPWGPPPLPGQACAAVSCAMPVYKVAALAALENGTRRLTQYEIAAPPPVAVNTPLFTQGPLTINGSASLFMSGDDRCDPDCNPASNPLYPLNCGQLPGGRSGGNVAINGNAGTGCPLPARLTGECCSDVLGAPNYDPNCVCQAGNCYPLGQNEAFQYNFAEILQELLPMSRPGTDVVAQYGGTLTLDDNGTPGDPSDDFYAGTNLGLGTLPAPWLPPIGTTPIGNRAEITYFDKDIHITAMGSRGSGILIVDGDLQINGGFQFYGLVIATGTVTFAGGGGAAKNIVGSIIAGGGVAGSSVGGNFDLDFDSCALNNQFRDMPVYILAFREVE